MRLDPADADGGNPSVPHWGGPTALNTTGTNLFQHIYSYGNSSLRLGLTELSPKKESASATRAVGGRTWSAW